MSEDMNLSVNGQSQVLPGFRFHPTEEELLHYYLRKKVASEKIDLDVIRDVDLNKLEPWDIQEKCKIGSTPQNDWYFFSHKDKKYPTGTRTNRATAAGFWKATGRDKVIYSSLRRIGMRKTLVFYKGRTPHGQKSDWIMHEYRLDDHSSYDATANNVGGDSLPEEGWVVCRVFKKQNFQKALESPQSFSPTSMDLRSQIICNSTNKDAILDQILQYMGKSCKQETQTITTPNNGHMLYLPSFNTAIDALQDRFTHLPRLETAPTNSPFDHESLDNMFLETEPSCTEQGSVQRDWVVLDQLVASQPNGQDDASNEDFCFPVDDNVQLSQLHLRSNRVINNVQSPCQGFSSEIDLWSFPRSSSASSSDPLCHLSV